MSVAVEQKLSEVKIDYINPKWDFIWAGHKKPKLNDELSQSLPKQWKYPMRRIIELKSMIDILDKNGIDTIQMINNDTQEIANIGIDVLKKDYSTRLSNLEILAKGDDKDSLNARAILYIADKFDYEKHDKNMKTSTFISALFGTAQMINGVEKEISNLDFNDKVTEENKENLNYFGRKMLELKEKPQSKEELGDDDFIKTFLDEAKGKADEIDRLELESDFNAEMIETAEMVKDKEIANEKTKEQNNENILDSARNSNETNNDSFVKDFVDTYTQTHKLSAKTQKLDKALGSEKSELESELESNAKMRETLEKDGFYQFNYFTAKKEYMEYDKQQGIIQSKQSFMKEFKQYSAKDMSVDEMRVLIALSNSKNSKLTPEHKLLIKDCLHIAQKENKNFQFLSEGHKAIIRANSNQKLGTQSIKEFLAFANTPKNKMDKLDNTILNNCKESCVKSIMANNKDLPQATITKLTALINPALAKTMEAGANMGRTLTK